ncbi:MULTISPECIES: Bug family tripartite tricarboxylate transporter substrate binding protein [Bordetella]|uniref:ABC transporter substrate-binding protein n=1 Tax=Bordetella genomosp. 6 TaxID=463024 RepID=A0ABX4FEK4_9BORD|nr:MULTISPECIES: tripartite tricarboxylate transporter substrate binding protein [Bordetella]AOB28547.1 ABC transporter substrate-binding protein [Bordetella bronchiseptica]ARP75121.1 ABC transporter substrate-binding protein [Bordetella genomosp. 6]AZW45894.1 tripartite tricarboxylate transporter substrate binding protein [Bordetella bronchiseptica]KCV66163.1 tripartite tricarboxylate transporter family receptor [Bordetella bronchiseptica 99-R-0433]KDD20883.1 tripartite tricarboxylate transpo
MSRSHSFVSATRRALLGGALAVAAGLSWTVPAVAQGDAFPTKPLRFVVPYPPGGPLDSMARLLAEKVRESLGQPIIVENRSGAGGNIGADLVAKAAPDGYTLVMGAVATHAINPWLFANLPYDPVKDFAPVTIVASVPNVLVMNLEFAEKNNIQNLGDLLAYAKKNPGRLNYGSGGNGSAGHLSGELLKARAGIAAEHIPYQGAAPAQLALLSGQSDFMFDNLAAAAPLIKDGKVKALAVTTAKRSSLLADVPTVEEAGVKGFDLGTWFGVFTTGGTPADVVARLNKAYADAMRLPDVRQRLLTMGSEAEPMTADAFAAFVKQEMAKYQEIVKISGASLN